MVSSNKTFSIGVLGTGAFTLFSVEAFLEVDGVTLAGAYDINENSAGRFAEKYRCRIFKSAEALINDADIDIIYIATPPNLHYPQSRQALLAGKHVICEKPAALRADEVKELIDIADSRELLYVVNLMQRYNPLREKVKWLIDEAVFGDFLHGYFENYASDESLVPDHWMWDEDISGGIFIEHAVHFFDLFEGLLGPGNLVSSQKIRKPGHKKDYYSEVQATVKYDPGLVNFYHGFTQPSRMDRQEMRFLFEMGEITLHEWVPTLMEVKGLVTKESLEKLKNKFPDAEFEIVENIEMNKRSFVSQFKERHADFLINMVVGKDTKKLNIYKNLLIDMISDQLAWISNHEHKRVITSENAYRSVLIAEEANNRAQLL